MSISKDRQKSVIFFDPWVGTQYGSMSKFHKKVLVLGESHYFGDDLTPTKRTTIDCIKEQITGNEEDRWTHRFFTGIVKALAGYPAYLDITRKQKQQVWDSIAFFNCIQDKTIRTPRVPPTEEMCIDGRKAFREILNLTLPQCCIVLGYRLWDNLPTDGERGPKISDGHREESWYYSLPNGSKLIAYPIYHPSSSRFSPDEWHPQVKKVIGMA